MSVQVSINNIVNGAINDIHSTLQNNDIMFQIVEELVDRLKKTNIVTPGNKEQIGRYLTHLSKSRPIGIGIKSINLLDSGLINPGIFDNIGSDPKNLLIMTVLYYVSDLNKYDFHLINYAMENNISVKNIIVLLLLNNTYDINRFCYINSITGQRYYTILTLKKLSGLHKVENNF